MKKYLSISAIVMLAILPVAANARDLTSEELAMGAAAENDAGAIATAGYVKSAYNVLAPRINDKQEKLTTTQMSAVDSGITAEKRQQYDNAVSAIQALGGGSTTSVADQITASAEDATFTSEPVSQEDDTPLLSAENIGDAINELAREKADAATAATKTGVTATISASTATVPVKVVATWGSATESTVNVTANLTGAAYTE